MKKRWSKVTCTVLALLVCLMVIPLSPASAAGDAMSLDQVRKLMNAEPLYPQKTGYVELDQLLEKLVAPYEGKDTYTTLKGLYEWTVNNIDYSWNGYSQDYAPAYDCFTLTYPLTYETGLPQAYPRDMIDRAYHMLTARTGVCYDWGILFAVMARYVGIESYVHTGILRIGTWTGHHGWTELKLGGKNYIFDGQQDWRSKGIYGRIMYDHFGISMDAAWRYTQETGANAKRDASMLPVTDPRVRIANVEVVTSRSGKIQGAGACVWGEETTLTSAGDLPVVGWYSSNGTLLSYEPTYILVPKGDTTLCALFEGDTFIDIPANAWYLDDVLQATQMELVTGMSEAFFEPGGTMNRAMFATLLYRVEGAAGSQSTAPFEDVSSNSWYADAVNWAYDSGVVHGISETEFAPMQNVTREQAATMMVQYLESKGIVSDAQEPYFTDNDKISDYAWQTLAQAQELGLMQGYEDGSIRPQRTLSRAEGVSLLMNLLECLEAA